MRTYKYKNQTIQAESHKEACEKLGISMRDLKKYGKIIRYLTKEQRKAEKLGRGYEEKQLQRRLKSGDIDKNWYQKYIIKELKLNGCVRCGYNKSDRALCFHHVEPSLKKFEIRVGRIRVSEFAEEFAKTMCLCLNCHAEVHEQMENEYDKEIEERESV